LAFRNAALKSSIGFQSKDYPFELGSFSVAIRLLELIHTRRKRRKEPKDKTLALDLTLSKKNFVVPFRIREIPSCLEPTGKGLCF
jgi:hypothetical protein